ncbi:hypothetical protein HMPREF9123_1568 [Neisseria bacilliformis ATCC BAA-1200]|uniref:Uncharacterized protein n=1 Tax=Neisseria bacilliformis ATCC BAA-1200 TaxID=888742 RepID=F2BD11_9NEIS|nr:hypothetical protein HMPREF9123_1568 [Neisseria bacilliformis ATCC BAA-1200]
MNCVSRFQTASLPHCIQRPSENAVSMKPEQQGRVAVCANGHRAPQEAFADKVFQAASSQYNTEAV